MKIICIIPARYQSTRFEGKPLAKILNKPMIWWVHNQVKKVESISEIYVATDDQRIVYQCKKYGIQTIMTSLNLSTHLDRLYEASKKVDFDLIINVNGDEPIIDPKIIESFIPKNVDVNESLAFNAYTHLINPSHVIDNSKIKVVMDINKNALYFSRSPIPYPQKNINFQFKKFIGLQCFTRKALEFCGNHKSGPLEAIEDIDEFRFLENGHQIKMVEVDSASISVDTRKDIDYVEKYIKDNSNLFIE